MLKIVNVQLAKSINIYFFIIAYSMNSFTNTNQEKADMQSLTKLRDVIVIIDNRNETQYTNRTKSIDFRGSAFKQTQVDPNESKPDISFLNDQSNVVKRLRQRVLSLEARVKVLEIQNQNRDHHERSNRDENDKKKRRRFHQMSRDYKCCHSDCGKIYGSQTSLKNHLKIKHNI